jgi:hypothetical protein
MDRVTQRLWRGVEEPVLSVAEGTSGVLNLPMLSQLFNQRGPTTGSAPITHLVVTRASFHAL